MHSLNVYTEKFLLFCHFYKVKAEPDLMPQSSAAIAILIAARTNINIYTLNFSYHLLWFLSETSTMCPCYA